VNSVYILVALEAGPVIVERLLGAISPDRLDSPTHADRFTPREVLAHLADWEPIMRDRIRQAVEEPDSTITPIDEGDRAAEQNYAAWDIGETMANWKAERAKTLAYVRSVPGDRWHDPITHPERGPVSAADLTSMIVGHDTYHVEQLSAVL
jgi:hypothetical protein